MTSSISSIINRDHGGGMKKAGIPPTETATVATSRAYRTRGGGIMNLEFMNNTRPVLNAIWTALNAAFISATADLVPATETMYDALTAYNASSALTTANINPDTGIVWTEPDLLAYQTTVSDANTAAISAYDDAVALVASTSAALVGVPQYVYK